MAQDILLLSRSDVQRLVSTTELLAELRKGFVSYSKRTIDALRVPIPLPADRASADASGIVIAPGLADTIPAYTVKVHAKFPGSDPAIQGLVILHDLNDGRPLAVLESSFLTALRTGLAGAVGADVLAKPSAKRVAIIGAGVQGHTQLENLRLVRDIAFVSVFDRSEKAAHNFAEAQGRTGLDTKVAGSLEDAVEGADIVITSTWAREPFLHLRHTKPGMHISTFGPDQPGKCEVSADVLRTSRTVVDDKNLAVAMGAVGGAGLDADAIAAELGEVLDGRREGRTSETDVTVFGSVGLAFQDLVVAWMVYRRAQAEKAGQSWTALD